MSNLLAKLARDLEQKRAAKSQTQDGKDLEIEELIKLIHKILQFFIFQKNQPKMDDIQKLMDLCFNICQRSKTMELYDRVILEIRGISSEIIKTLTAENFSNCFAETTKKFTGFYTGLQCVSKLLMQLGKCHIRIKMVDKKILTKESEDFVISKAAIVGLQKIMIEKKAALQGGVREIVRKERNGEDITEKTLLSELRNFCLSLGENLYKEILEDFLESESKTHFSDLSNKLFEENTSYSYIQKAQQIYEKEASFFEFCFAQSTKHHITEMMRQIFFFERQNALIHKPGSGLSILIAENDLKNLKAIYTVLHRHKSLQEISFYFKEHIVKDVKSLIPEDGDEKKEQDQKDEKSKTKNTEKDDSGKIMIETAESVIKRRIFYEDMMNFAFAIPGLKVIDEDFQKMLSEAFNIIVQQSKHNFAESLALLLDDHLSKPQGTHFLGNSMESPQKIISAADAFAKWDALASVKQKDAETQQNIISLNENQSAETFFDGCIKLLRHITDKDTFAHYYKQFLARRLLITGVQSQDDEQKILEKIKKATDNNLTRKLEDMIKDMEISNQSMEEWKKFRNKKQQEKHIQEPIDLTVKILTQNCWPSAQHIPINISKFPSLKDQTDFFGEFYLEKHSGRKLTWLFTFGNGDLRLNGFDKNYEISCPTPQMFVLLLFNEKDSWSIKDIISNCFSNQSQTSPVSAGDSKLTLSKLKTILIPLVLPVHKQLAKILVQKNQAPEKGDNASENKKFDLKEDDVLMANNTFSSTILKNKFRVLNKKLDKEQKKKLDDTVNDERKFVVDAAVVRNMKARKTMGHQELTTEVIRQLMSRFPLDSKFVKTRIEILIDQEYLARDENDRSIYNYLA